MLNVQLSYAQTGVYFDCLLMLNLLTFDGVRATPPVGDWNADSGEDHAESLIVIQQIMVVITCAYSDGWQVLTNGQFLLKIGGLDLLL